MFKMITLYLMALLYIAAGANHFVNPKFYMRIMPPYLPMHKELVFWSGVAEVMLGIMLFIPATQTLAAWGVILLLIAVFPANIYHFTSGGAGMKISRSFLIARLPIQLLLILWAYWYTF